MKGTQRKAITGQSTCRIAGNRKCLAIAAIILVFLILFNLLLGMASEKGALQADMTTEKIFSLSKESSDFLENLSEDVTITVLERESDFIDKGDFRNYFIQVDTIIKKCAECTPHISLRYVDTKVDEDFLKNYKTYQAIDFGDIIVECGDKFRVIADSDLFNLVQGINAEQKNVMSISSSKAEQMLVSAINHVVNKEPMKVSFLLGYGEHENYKNFASFLRDNGYEVLEQSLLTEEIDPDTAIVIIFAPEWDYDASVTESLKDFLYNGADYGRSLVYVANSQQQEDMTNLSGLLASWGVIVGDGVIVETEPENGTEDDYFAGQCSFVSNAFTSNLKNKMLPVLVPYSRPITLDDSYSYSLYPLLSSSDTSGIYLPTEGEPDLNEISASGPFLTAVLSSYFETNLLGSLTGVDGHVAVIGSEYALSEDLFNSTSNNNAGYFLNMLSYMSGQENTLFDTAPKSFYGQEQTISSGWSDILTVVFMIVFPIGFLCAGIFVWLKQKGSIRTKAVRQEDRK